MSPSTEKEERDATRSPGLCCARRALKPFPASAPSSHAGRGHSYHAAHKIGSGRNFSVECTRRQSGAASRLWIRRWAAGARTEGGATTQPRGPRPRPLTSPHSRRDSSCRRCSRSDRQAGRVTGSAGRGRGREVTAATRGRWLRTSASSHRRRAGPPRPPRRTRRPPSWPNRRARLLASRMTRVSGHLPPARWPLRSRDSRAGVSQRSGLERGRLRPPPGAGGPVWVRPGLGPCRSLSPAIQGDQGYLGGDVCIREAWEKREDPGNELESALRLDLLTLGTGI